MRFNEETVTADDCFAALKPTKWRIRRRCGTADGLTRTCCPLAALAFGSGMKRGTTTIFDVEAWLGFSTAFCSGVIYGFEYPSRTAADAKNETFRKSMKYKRLFKRGLEVGREVAFRVAAMEASRS